jgi:hypothetical protein
MRQMETYDIFFCRLQLLVVMSRGYLAGAPPGEFRNRAILNTARRVANDTVDWNGRVHNFRTDSETKRGRKLDPAFFQKVKLLTVIAKSFVSVDSMGDFRRNALDEALAMICEAIGFNGSSQAMKLLEIM